MVEYSNQKILIGNTFKLFISSPHIAIIIVIMKFLLYQKVGGGGLIIIKASKPELVQSPNRLPVSSVDLTALINTCAQKFVAKLYGNPRLPRNLVQKIIDDLEGFFGGCFVEIVKSEVLQTLSESSETKQNRIDEIERMFNKLENPFKDLRSEHLRFKHLENSGYYIAPVSFIIGETKAPKASFSGV